MSGVLALRGVLAATPCAETSSCRVHLTVAGAFSTAAPWHVNRLNGPAHLEPTRPLPLAISQRTLDELNAVYGAAARSAVTELGWAVVEGPAELVALERKAEPLQGRSGDRLFALRIEVGAPDRLGGNDGGDELRAVVRSLHRPATWVGTAVEPVRRVGQARWQDRAVRSAARAAVERALDELSGRLRADAQTSWLPITIGLSGLGPAEREHVRARLVPCLAGLYEVPAGMSPGLHEAGGFLNVRVPHLRTQQSHWTAAEHAANVRAAVGQSAKHACGVGQSPLSRFAARVEEDAVNEGVVLTVVGR